MQNDEQAIRDLVETWLSATKAGDLATVLDLTKAEMTLALGFSAPIASLRFTTVLEFGCGAAGAFIIGSISVACFHLNSLTDGC